MYCTKDLNNMKLFERSLPCMKPKNEQVITTKYCGGCSQENQK